MKRWIFGSLVVGALSFSDISVVAFAQSDTGSDSHTTSKDESSITNQDTKTDRRQPGVMASDTPKSDQIQKDESQMDKDTKTDNGNGSY